MRRPISNSNRGAPVYEPFSGSGTTLIAAETVGRVCLALELEPAYCDVIVERWAGASPGNRRIGLAVMGPRQLNKGNC